MADLPTTTGGGSQTTTQSPQTATSSDPAGTQANNVQPGTDNNLLKSPGSVQLTPTPLPTISLPNLNETRTTTGTPKDSSPAESGSVNYVLLGGSLLILVVAVIFFVVMSRSEKNTTI